MSDDAAQIAQEVVRAAREGPSVAVATVVRAPEPRHGKTSAVRHDGKGIFLGVADPTTATRYHSLMVDERTLPADLEVTARSDDGVVMGLRHRTLPLEAVQFHPESVLTVDGPAMLRNFLEGRR